MNLGEDVPPQLNVSSYRCFWQRQAEERLTGKSQDSRKFLQHLEEKSKGALMEPIVDQCLNCKELFSTWSSACIWQNLPRNRLLYARKNNGILSQFCIFMIRDSFNLPTSLSLAYGKAHIYLFLFLSFEGE